MDRSNKKPIIDGLEVRYVEVNGNDPRWSGKIDFRRYFVCEEEADSDDFPVEPGMWLVHYVLLPYQRGNTLSQERARINLLNFECPNRAITETALDALVAECAEDTIIGICGVIKVSSSQFYSTIGCVSEGLAGRSLELTGLGFRPNQDSKFVAVVSRTRIG